MVLAYARDAERTLQPEFRSDLFDHAVSLAAYHLESGREGARVLYGPGADEARQNVLTADDVAHRLSQVPLPEVTAVALRSALADAVDAARYWQDPDGEDILVAAEPVRRELRRVAEHIARSRMRSGGQCLMRPISGWWAGVRTVRIPLGRRPQSCCVTMVIGLPRRKCEPDAIVRRIRRRTGPAGGGRLHLHGVRPGGCSTGPRPACGSSRTAWDGSAPSRDE